MSDYQLKRDMFDLAVTSYVLKHGGPGPHGTGTSQDIHSSRNDAGDGEQFWDGWFTKPEGLIARDGNPLPEIGLTALSLTAAALVGRGAARNYGELVDSMRGMNRAQAHRWQGLGDGDITLVDPRDLDVVTEGYGFRLGNSNHINRIARDMRANGYQLNKAGPIHVAVWDDGVQMVDGAHRAGAARRAGIDNVPVQVHRLQGNMPEPQGFRGQWDELRRQRFRASQVREAAPTHRQLLTRPDTPVERWFNDRMASSGSSRRAQQILGREL